MFHTYKKDKANVPPAGQNKVRWFIDESTNMLAFIDEGGTIKTAGNSITNISKTQTVGNVDTYTITYTDGQNSNFTITNGVDGNGVPSNTAPSQISPSQISSIGTQTTKYALSDHTHAVGTGIASVLGENALEGTSDLLSRADHVHPFPTPEQLGAAKKQDIDSAVRQVPKRLLGSFTVDFLSESDIFYLNVPDLDVSLSKPPVSFTVKPEEDDWDISYRVILSSVQEGSFNVSVIPEDISGDSLIGLPLPQITVYYLKEVDHA